MLSARRALVLGALHGPAELLPVSSSAHVAVIPWLLGWDYDELDPDLRKAFEVALHAGTAVALIVAMHGRDQPWRPAVIATATAPPATAGFLLEGAIERRAGTPRAIAAALAAGSMAMLAAERSPETRGIEDVGLADGLWLGLAQACALVPGISRSGATLTAARCRRFRAADAELLSRQVAIPVIAGAAALKSLRLAQRPPEARTLRALALGAGASLVSTLVAARRLDRAQDRSLNGFAVYRLVLAALLSKRAAAT